MFRPVSSILVGNTRRIALQKSTFLRCYATESTTKKDKPTKNKPSNGDEVNNFDVRYLGITSDHYVPVSWKNFPNPITSPKLAWKSLIRRFYTFGFNTVQVGLLRYQVGLKPKFLLWKNNAIENYVQVNKAFANKNIQKASKTMSVWVAEALQKRVDSIPKNLRLDWRLVKFNEVPKLITFRPVMLPGQPVEYVQVVYKFNTTQELIKVNLNDEKTSKIQRNVVDYIGFTVDLHNNETTLAGSLFESSPHDPIPTPESIQQSEMFNDMRERGDLFRLPPSNLPKN